MKLSFGRSSLLTCLFLLPPGCAEDEPAGHEHAADLDAAPLALIASGATVLLAAPAELVKIDATAASPSLVRLADRRCREPPWNRTEEWNLPEETIATADACGGTCFSATLDETHVHWTDGRVMARAPHDDIARTETILGLRDHRVFSVTSAPTLAVTRDGIWVATSEGTTSVPRPHPEARQLVGIHGLLRGAWTPPESGSYLGAMSPTFPYPKALSAILSLAALAACGDASPPDLGSEEADQTSWRAPAEGSCEAHAMLKVANEATLEELDVDASLDGRAAANIVAARPFETVRAIDDVPRVGPATLKAIFEHARAKGLLAACTDGEIGVVSDLDKTIIPAAEPDLSRAPYPGVTKLLYILEHRNDGAAGDVYYVTARTPDGIADVPAYLEEHGVPPGTIETGVSGVPWVAQAEKVRDIEGILARTGNQRFVFFGDTSHRDPEVYKEVLAAHPDRVIAVFIHKVNATVSPARVEGLHLHDSYAVVAAKLYGMSVLTREEARSVMEAAKDEGLAITPSQMDQLLDENTP